jgi:hypothetical protein
MTRALTIMIGTAMFASACADYGKCEYEGSVSGPYGGYEYRCLNVRDEAECEQEHPKTGEFSGGECCDPDTSFVDNPEACGE